MNPETYVASESINGLKKSGRVQSIGFYALLVTIILAPIVFWPSAYIALDTIKTFVIGFGVLVSAVCFGISALQERSITLPPKKILWISILLVASLIISALVSTHTGKSLFGQGFELNTASFLATVFLAGLLTFSVVQRRVEKAIVLYAGICVSYLIVFIFQTLRLIFGSGFAAFSVFTSQTSSLLGNWTDLGTFSVLVAIISLSAIMFLTPSKKIKIMFWVLTVLSIVAGIVIFNPHAWLVAFAILIGFTIISSSMRMKKARGTGYLNVIKKVAWIPLVGCIVVGLFIWKTDSVIGPVVRMFNTGYSEMSLTWQPTLDVAAGAIKQNPYFGIGTNHFSGSYLTFKPDQINLSDAWGVEFNYGFGLIPTLIVEQGLVGLILWILFFVFLGLMGAKVLKASPDKTSDRFVAVSSFVASVLLWAVAIISVPSHIILLLTLIMTGIFLGSSVRVGISSATSVDPKSERGSTTFKIFTVIFIVIMVLWGYVYTKKLVALSYFGSGVKALTVNNDPDSALASFAAANKIDHSDVYLQGETEAMLNKANQLATQISKATNASSSDSLIKQFADTVNAALIDSRAAISFDPTDYYNRISEARVSEVATNFKMQNAYDNALAAYTSAINLNPKNPSIYLNLAKLQVSQSKFADATKTIGAALQVKPNYLDAVFLLSQVYAANGDLANAIVAGKFAVQLNPQNAQVYFQLGLLQYNNKDYEGAVDSFESALKLQSDYANAQYFLGLSYARVGRNSDAITQFQALTKSNPDNQEVATILNNLIAGKSLFASPQTVSAPDKRSSLPIKAKK